MSIPVQCTQELPKYLLEKPQLLTATAHGPAAQCGADHLRRNVGTFSDLLAEDMSKLCVDGPHRRKENQEMVQNIKPLLSLDSLKWQGAPSSVSKNALQADHHSRDRTMYTARVGIYTLAGRGSPFCHYIVPHIVCVFVSDICTTLPGRWFPESTLRDADVRRGAAVSCLWFLPGGLSRGHNHQRRVLKTPYHPCDLDWTVFSTWHISFHVLWCNDGADISQLIWSLKPPWSWRVDELCRCWC